MTYLGGRQLEGVAVVPGHITCLHWVRTASRRLRDRELPHLELDVVPLLEIVEDGDLASKITHLLLVERVLLGIAAVGTVRRRMGEALESVQLVGILLAAMLDKEFDPVQLRDDLKGLRKLVAGTAGAFVLADNGFQHLGKIAIVGCDLH